MTDYLFTAALFLTFGLTMWFCKTATPIRKPVQVHMRDFSKRLTR